MRRVVFFLLFLIPALSVKATHNVAGEITMQCVNGTNYKATITTYTYLGSQVDRCYLEVSWGDGTPNTIAHRINGIPGTPCAQYEGNGEVVPGYPMFKKNIYVATHPYSPGTYNVSVTDPYRVGGIVNITNSLNVPLTLVTTFTVDPQIGCNSTPVLNTIPLDEACLNHCFYHNPGAVDPDHDSLSYSIGPALDSSGNPVVGYYPPNSAWPHGGGGVMTINPVTGDLSWCSPGHPGRYNLVIYINEWRNIGGTWLKIGTVRRDMSIDVSGSCSNDNPVISDIPDLCVDAGQLATFNATISDPNPGDSVKLEGYGSTFSTVPPATLTNSNSYNLAPFNTTYSWNTNCDEVQLQPWIVTLKALDNNSHPLMHIQSARIEVVSPGPGFLTALPQGTTMNLTWGQNPCDPTTNYCKGYKIYRRVGPSNWTPAHCETGVPAYTGFVQIGTVYGVTNTTFTDNNSGTGLITGSDYCYRVCAFFKDGAESYASPEACAVLLQDVPVLVNVDVMTTGMSDNIFLRWVNPLANGIDFDTIAKPGPYKIELYRQGGFSITGAQLITSFTANSFYQLPTTYIDNGLQTSQTPYTYRLKFYYSGNQLEGSCYPASSVYLSATPSDNQVALSWQYAVPWMNDAFAVYRYNNSTSSWDSLALVTGNSYIDGGLENGVEYCYFVTSHSSYHNVNLPPVTFNRSEQTCATPVDLTPPCPPSLIVNSDCEAGNNVLVWTNPMHSACGTDDVVAYQVWYSPVEGQAMQQIGTISSASDTVSFYTNLNSVAGCYAITATDTFNNQSVFSNIVCVDNCPYYELPNVFTPNGDNVNDYFIPFPYRNVKGVDIKIYDRWGKVVYQTKDPNVHWDGRDMNTGQLCTDGVYYYTCTVEEIRLSGILPRELKGFVHLFGKDVAPPH